MTAPGTGNSVTTIIVAVGNTPTYGGNVVQGSLVVNTSDSDAVWVSSASNVTPGNGIRIGALGTVTWMATAPLYAVVDTGVTSAVTLHTTPLISNPVNPVDTAVAVAAELAITGIPTKLVTDYLGALTVGPGTTFVSGAKNFELYGSLFLYGVPNQVPNGVPYLPITFQWRLTSTGNLIGRANTMTFNGVTPVPYIPGMLLPILGDQLTITNPNTYGITLAMIGYSRQVSDYPIGNGFSTFITQWSGSKATSGDCVLGVDFGNPPQGECYVMTTFTFPSGQGTVPPLMTFRVTDPQDLTTFASLITQANMTAFTPTVYTFAGFLPFPAAAYALVAHFTSSPTGGSFSFTVRAIPNYAS